jgi:hypothetical protein
MLNGMLRSAKSRRGNCYVASEALYHILGGSKAGWTPIRSPMLGNDKKLDTHWAIRHKSGLIIDPSRLQFSAPNNIDYSTFRGAGFLTKKPSKRAVALMKLLTWQE